MNVALISCFEIFAIVSAFMYVIQFGFLPLFGHITVVRKYISCILLSISCNRCLVAKGERVNDIFAEKDCWNKLQYFGFSRRLVRYFWLKYFL